MSDRAPHAVFLSYAREDAPAASRLAEALRSQGVEVWFDQDELRGGDAWDAKIKTQIRECALFLPVISAHTQERGEGYFRREWRLAIERTHDMAEGVPFLAPVVIDETPESGAAVPEQFLRVQWTRLPGALPTPPFVEQVKRLLAAPRKPAPGYTTPPMAPRPATAADARDVAPPSRRLGIPGWAWGAAAAAVIAGALLVFQRTRKTEATVTPPRPAVAAKAGPALPDDKSIAVLPFENRSAEQENAFFTDGVHDDILTSLQNIRELRVVSRTSVMQYRATTKPVRQIAQELGVLYILEGGVQRSGNMVHITGQLINARTDEHLWAKSYDRQLSAGTIFAIQTELAQAIASELKAALSPAEKKLLERQPTQNAAAYDLFLKARDAFHRGDTGPAALHKQATLLQAAVALDARFAEAWGELARVHAQFRFYNYEYTADRLAKATEAIEKAAALAPDAPEIIEAIGNHQLYGHRDYARATGQFERLSRLQPNNSAVIFALGEIRQRQAKWQAAVDDFRRATQLDPGNRAYAHALAELLRGGRRWDEAFAAFRRLAELRGNALVDRYYAASIPFRGHASKREMEEFFAALTPAEADSSEARRLRLDWARQTGDYAEAIRLDRLYEGKILGLSDVGFAGAMTLFAHGDKEAARARIAPRAEAERNRLKNEPDNTDALWKLGLAEAMLGHREEALRCAARVVELLPVSFDAVDGAAASNRLAHIYAWAGETDRAIAETARLVQTPMVTTNVQYMKADPWWFPLRGDPRFEALLNDPKNNAPLF